jgi:signal transduction histidine kinase
MAGTNEDITDRKRAEDALKEAFERERETVIKLRELDQAKTIFTSSVSHELRTPLTSIIGYLDLLQETQREGLNDTQRQMLAVVERNSQRLLGLIEDLLTFSRLQSGTFEPSIGPVSLGELFASVRDAVLPQAVARELDLRFEAVDGLTVAGDGAQLESVLQNLLSNAIKFTPAGGSVVVGASEAHGVVTITVEDTGIGVPPGELSSLFSPFFRSSNAEGLAVPGTGLGLAIVKAIIEGHGGTIEISSEEGRGATVSVSLPAADVTRRKSA